MPAPACALEEFVMLYGKIFHSAIRTGLAALLLALCMFLSQQGAFAAPTTAAQAKAVVGNWLALNNSAPLEESLDQGHVGNVSTYTADGQTLYYLVHLQQAGEQKGFVVVPADDLVEPIVGIFPEAVEYSPSSDNPVGALVHQDLQGRMAKARAQDRGEMRTTDTASQATAKWQYLLSLHDATAQGTEQGMSAISDVRVAPVVQSTWNQSTACGENTYNIYTPNNYVCGCVATAMAQLLRFHNHPTSGVGTGSFEIEVDGVTESRSLLGGDGSGGPYSWGNMPYSPGCDTSTVQRQAISRLTHDAGVSVNMSYTSSSSGTDTLKAATAFRTTFGYSNAIYHYAWGNNIDSADLYSMLNANLNAGLPVVLGIYGPYGGHAIVCDGYGYDTSTPYHHLNMGWGSYQDAWYNLPTIDSGSYTFNSVYKVVYNVFPTGTGEIISGRVLDQSGNPISGVTVTATVAGSGSFSDTTDSRGVFGLRHVPSNSSATLTATKAGYTFSSHNVTTGESSDTYYGGSGTIGNTWQSDITAGGSAQNALPFMLPLLLDSQ